MEAVKLSDKITWVLKFDGRPAIYMLSWGGKNYIGSSIKLSSRLYWWRADRPEATVRVLLVCTPEDRFMYEAALIKKYELTQVGWNKTITGKGGSVHGHTLSEEAKQKISKANTGKRRTDEAKKLMSEKAKLRGNHGPEAREKAAAKLRGQKRSPEQRQALSDAMSGIPKSEAHKAALKVAWVLRRQNRAAGLSK